MPSLSLQKWFAERVAALADIESAHRAVRGSGPGARAATQQVNQAYAVLLSSQFQAFCRDLHSEAVDCICRTLSPTALQTVVHLRLIEGRKLDQGNPNPGNLGAD